HHAQMREGPNMRTFEIPAAGAFQLADYKARMGEMFEVGAELAVYHDTADVVEQINRFLDDESARRAISLAGQRRVQRDHTYTIRMQQLIDDALDG
ncbi:MAG: glycosyltransferase, partial [Chloroflexi bacterium]|nr:glycosyltransferase [Chloroflexota bacterium]